MVEVKTVVKCPTVGIAVPATSSEAQLMVPAPEIAAVTLFVAAFCMVIPPVTFRETPELTESVVEFVLEFRKLTELAAALFTTVTVAPAKICASSFEVGATPATHVAGASQLPPTAVETIVAAGTFAAAE